MRKEAPNLGSGEGREIPPENELSREANKNPEEFLIPKTPQETIPERTPSPPEAEIFQKAPSTPESRVQVETPPSQERKLSLEQPKNLNWFQRKIKEQKEEGELLIRKLEKKGILLTKKDKRKLLSIPALWAIHALVSTWIGNVIVGGSFLSLIRHRDLSVLPSLLPYNLIPCSIRFGAIFAFEKFLDIKFSGRSKVTAILCGWAMPVEIAIMSKERQLLFNEIKEHYFKTPLTWVRGAIKTLRNVFGR